jgi:hypothetical protein
MVTPLSENPIPPLSVTPVAPISGNAGSPSSAPDRSLFGNHGRPVVEISAISSAEITVNAEGGAILELAVQAAQPAALSPSIATPVAATVDISPEALAQAAAWSLPATLTGDSSAVPKSLVARPARSEGPSPISELNRWQDAIRFFDEEEDRPSRPSPKPRPFPFAHSAEWPIHCQGPARRMNRPALPKRPRKRLGFLEKDP